MTCHVWHDGSPQLCLVKVLSSRTWVKVQGHRRKMVGVTLTEGLCLLTSECFLELHVSSVFSIICLKNSDHM